MKRQDEEVISTSRSEPQFLANYSQVCYSGRSYNERMLKQTVVSIKSGRYNERGGILSILFFVLLLRKVQL
jgi:hypothetical protein